MRRSLRADPPSPELLLALSEAGVSPETLAGMDRWKALEVLALIRSTSAQALAGEYSLLGRRHPTSS